MVLDIMKRDQLENNEAVCILKKHGPQSVKALAEKLGVSTEGARFHLLKLERDGLVQSKSEVKGRGRPMQSWSLTEKGNAHFPDTHSELTVNLITLMRETLGNNAVDKVIDKHEQQTLSRYQEQMRDCKDLEGKVARLAEIRSNEGYMAEYEKDADGFLFIENHCPICAAATICQGFCTAELNIFKTVLGKDTKIERVEHIIAGERRCAYRITPS